MVGGLEKKFFTKEEIEMLMRNNPRVSEVIKDTSIPELAFELGAKYVADAINAKRIERDDITVYTTAEQMINSSNQHLWAYASLDPKIHNHHWTERIAKILKILWDSEAIPPSEENAGRFMRKSLELAERAVKADGFKDEYLAHIICNYIGRGRRTGEDPFGSRDVLSYKPLLVRFLEKMKKSKGLEVMLDFFDQNLVDAQFLHPFNDSGLLTSPYAVRDTFLRELKRELRGSRYEPDRSHQAELIRLCRTIANFNLHGTWEMFNVIYTPFAGINPRYPDEQIKDAYTEVRILVNLEGREFVRFMADNGFEPGVRERYIWEYNQETKETHRRILNESQFRHQSGYQQPKPVIDGLTSALNILGLESPPDKFESARAAYRRIVRLWHPDLCNLPEAEENMKKANLAWEIIEPIYKK
jgi:hypothetical protein